MIPWNRLFCFKSFCLVCVPSCMCLHHEHAGIRGQSAGLCFLLSFHFVGPRDWTQVVRLGGKYPYLVSRDLPRQKVYRNKMFKWGLNWIWHVISISQYTIMRLHSPLWVQMPLDFVSPLLAGERGRSVRIDFVGRQKAWRSWVVSKLSSLLQGHWDGLCDAGLLSAHLVSQERFQGQKRKVPLLSASCLFPIPDSATNSVSSWPQSSSSAQKHAHPVFITQPPTRLLSCSSIRRPLS